MNKNSFLGSPEAMNQLDYVVAITEDADTLFTLERQARHPKERQRLQLLRLLRQ